MSDIFISYARADRERAESLAQVFEEQKWSVWWDRDTLPGSKFSDVIARELSEAKAVVVLWSAASVVSDWVKDEAQEGKARGILAPAAIEKVVPPLGFRQIQTADLSGWDGSPGGEELQGLLRGIGGLINKPVTPSVARRRRPKLLYLAAGGVLCALLSVAAFFYFTGDGSRKGCSDEARQKALDHTGKGLLMIDPNGNYDAAVLHFKEATEVCGSYAEAFFWRGQSYIALQKNDRALADFKKVLELDADEEMRSTTEKFIADLENPRPAHTPATSDTPPVTMNTNSAVGPNSNASNTSAVNANGGVTANTNKANTNANAGPTPAKVNDIFAADKSTRIAATTRLIIERKQDPAAVAAAVSTALANPGNKSGVINTLVYLQSVDPPILKQYREQIERLLTAAKENGPQTADHIRKVQARLNS